MRVGSKAGQSSEISCPAFYLPERGAFIVLAIYTSHCYSFRNTLPHLSFSGDIYGSKPTL